jgi:hypothetical protein
MLDGRLALPFSFALGTLKSHLLPEAGSRRTQGAVLTLPNRF